MSVSASAGESFPLYTVLQSQLSPWLLQSLKKAERVPLQRAWDTWFGSLSDETTPAESSLHEFSTDELVAMSLRLPAEWWYAE
jgi:hypothetical protein